MKTTSGSRADEIVTRHKPKPERGYACPNCEGTGNLGDGSSSWSTTETRHRAPTPCPVCKGKKRVEVRPIDEEA